jgi:transposase
MCEAVMLTVDDYLLDAKVWYALKPFFIRYQRRTKHYIRDIVEAIVWILKTGAQWQHLPKHYPPRSTVHDWYMTFVDEGVFDDIHSALIEVLEEHGEIDMNVAAVDATFIRSRASLERSGKTKCGKGQKLMAIVDTQSRPLALFLSSAQPHEITLLKQTLGALKTQKKSGSSSGRRGL